MCLFPRNTQICIYFPNHALCQIQRSDKSFGTLEQFKYLETTFINQNFIREEIKGRLKSGNACYHSVQNPVSST